MLCLQFLQLRMYQGEFLFVLPIHLLDLFLLLVQLLEQRLHLRLHGFLLVLQVPNAVMEVFVLSLIVGLASAAADVLLFALRVYVDVIIFLENLLFAILAVYHRLVAFLQVISDIFFQILLIAVHAFYVRVQTGFAQVLFDVSSVHSCGAPAFLLRAIVDFKFAFKLFMSLELIVINHLITSIIMISTPKLEF